MANPYRVGIELAMSSNHQAVLSALSSGLLGVMPLVNQLQGHFNQLGLAVGGALSVFTGVEIFRGIEKFIEKTKDLSQEWVKLKNMGLTDAEVARVQKEAIRLTHAVPGTTELENLKIPGQTYSILGLENSIAIAEDLARYQNVIRNTSGHKGAENEKQLYQMLRSADLIGKLTNPETHQVDIETLRKYLDTGWKVMQGSHGMVTPQTWLNLAQQGGPALMNLNEQGLISMGMISQMMGGHRAGTAMMSLFGQMAGSQMPKRTAQGMQELGLIGSEEWKSGGGGGAGGGVILSNEARKRLTEQFQHDPLKFAEFLRKKMEDRGITGSEEQILEIFKIFGRQTTQRLGADIVRNLNQLQQERERLSGAAGVGESAVNRQKGDVAWNLRAIESAWENLQYALAGPNAEGTISMLQMLTGAINGLTDTVRGMDPKTVSGLGVGIAALGAAFIGAGAIAMLGAIGPAGWLVLGLGALGGAFLALKTSGVIDENTSFEKMFPWVQMWKDWGAKIKSLFGKDFMEELDLPELQKTAQEAGEVIRNSYNLFMKNLDLPELVKAVGELGTQLYKSIINMLHGVRDKILSFFGSLPSWLGGGTNTAPTNNTRKLLDDLSGATRGFGGAPPEGVPQRFDGSGPGARFFNINYAPDAGGNAISGRRAEGQSQAAAPVHISLNIDGRRIAEAISSALADLMTHPTQAPFHDTYGGYASTDSQIATT